MDKTQGGQGQDTVHDIVFAQAELNLDEIKASDWGKQVASYMAPMQAYLPSAKGNLYWAHDNYLGQALMTHHDYSHATFTSDTNETSCLSTMKIHAIIANAMVRLGQSELANLTIDFNHTKHVIEKLDSDTVLHVNNKAQLEAFQNNRIKIITAIYNEMGCPTY